MSSGIKGIDAVTLFVEDVDAAKKFYEIFGMPIVFENGDGVVFKFGNTLINLLKITEANELIDPALVARREVGSRVVFTIDVDDVDVKCAELIALGGTLLNGPMDRPWGIRTASFVDPDGYIWELAK